MCPLLAGAAVAGWMRSRRVAELGEGTIVVRLGAAPAGSVAAADAARGSWPKGRALGPRNLREICRPTPCAPGRDLVRFCLRRARSVTRSKPRRGAVRASGTSAGWVDESATGSANSFGPTRSVRPRSGPVARRLPLRMALPTAPAPTAGWPARDGGRRAWAGRARRLLDDRSTNDRLGSSRGVVPNG